MNLANYRMTDVEILTTREYRTAMSRIEVKFTHRTGVEIRASISCKNSIRSESQAQCHILESLGFTDIQIKEFNYD